MIRHTLTLPSTIVIVSVYIYTVLGMTGLFFGKANADYGPELLYKDWVFQHSIIDETIVQHFTFENIEGETVVLQKFDKDDNNWTKLYEHKFEKVDKNSRSREEQSIAINIKSPSEKGMVQYRIISGKYPQQTLYEFTVENHDPDDYSDYIKQAYDEVQQYCGNVFITEGDTEHMESRNAVGLAHSGLNKIELKTGMDRETVEWVVKHECGHILQHRAYDKDRETYPISEKRSILWLNDDLTPFYDEKFENDRGTGFSEKNADCIGALLGTDSSGFNKECNGNQAQAAHNIIEGKTSDSLIIHENIADKVRIKNTGFAVKEAECKYDSGIVSECSQQFEAGTVEWRMINGKDRLIFTRADGTISFGEEYFIPSLFDSYSNSNNKNFKEVVELYSPSEENV